MEIYYPIRFTAWAVARVSQLNAVIQERKQRLTQAQKLENVPTLSDYALRLFKRTDRLDKKNKPIPKPIRLAIKQEMMQIYKAFYRYWKANGNKLKRE